jgi:hypothetical protein
MKKLIKIQFLKVSFKIIYLNNYFEHIWNIEIYNCFKLLLN